MSAPTPADGLLSLPQPLLQHVVRRLTRTSLKQLRLVSKESKAAADAAISHVYIASDSSTCMGGSAAGSTGAMLCRRAMHTAPACAPSADSIFMVSKLPCVDASHVSDVVGSWPRGSWPSVLKAGGEGPHSPD